MLKEKKLKYFKTIDNIDYYLYKPSFGRWFYKDWDGFQYEVRDEGHGTAIMWLRMCLEWLEGGYKMYYAAVDDEIVGYNTIARGGRRLTISNKRDIVLGPTFVHPEHRGKGISVKMDAAILDELENDYEYAYMYIRKSNKACLKSETKKGFEYVCDVSRRGFLRRLYPKENGFFHVFRYANKH